MLGWWIVPRHYLSSTAKRVIGLVLSAMFDLVSRWARLV